MVSPLRSIAALLLLVSSGCELGDGRPEARDLQTQSRPATDLVGLLLTEAQLATLLFDASEGGQLEVLERDLRGWVSPADCLEIQPTPEDRRALILDACALPEAGIASLTGVLTVTFGSDRGGPLLIASSDRLVADGVTHTTLSVTASRAEDGSLALNTGGQGVGAGGEPVAWAGTLEVSPVEPGCVALRGELDVAVPEAAGIQAELTDVTGCADVACPTDGSMVWRDPTLAPEARALALGFDGDTSAVATNAVATKPVSLTCPM